MYVYTLLLVRIGAMGIALFTSLEREHENKYIIYYHFFNITSYKGNKVLECKRYH